MFIDSAFTPIDSFDIKTLTNFSPDDICLCQNCYAMLKIDPLIAFEEEVETVCPVCKVVYVPGRYKTIDAYSKARASLYLVQYGKATDFLKHAYNLARYADLSGFSAPMDKLLQLLVEAEKFVHVTSYGVSQFFIGALKLLASRGVYVRGIFSSVSDDTAELLNMCSDKDIHFSVKVYPKSFTVPHQKLIVIDGLVAVTGSTNLTINGWKNAEKGLDMVRVVTDIREVAEINNKYFSPLWKDPSVKKIVMG